MENTHKRAAIFIFVAIATVLVLAVFVDNQLIATIEENREYLYASMGVGSSMYPTIQNRDILVILRKNSPDFGIELGDILVYTQCQTCTPVAHRVIDIQDDTYYTKGDNAHSVAEIPYNYIIGKVVEIVGKTDIISKTIVNVYLQSSEGSYTQL